MQNILVASDLSVRSDRAIQRAARLVAKLGGQLRVVHVVDSAMPLALAETVRIQAETILRQTVKAEVAPNGPIPDIDVTIGDPVQDVARIAAETGAQLLVLGVHRERHFLDLIRQTTMERMIQASPTPVLLVADPVDDDYSRMLCAVDMSRACANAIRLGHTIAPTASRALFHAYHVPYRRLTSPTDAAASTLPFLHQAEQDFAAWKADADLPDDLAAPRFIDASPTVALDQMLANGSYDLMALGAHTRSNLGRYVLGGFTAGLIRNPPCDLLVAK